MITQGLAVVATGLAAIFLIPQIVRLVRHRDASGVSPVWAAFGVLTNLAWVVYLAVEGMWIATLAPALAVVSYGVVLAAVTRVDQSRRWVWWSVAYGLVFVVVSTGGGSTAAGLLLAVTPAIQLAPEVTAVYRKARPSGVSPTTWTLALAEALCWGGYGVLVTDPALVGYGVFTSLGALLVLARWWVRCGPRLPVPVRRTYVPTPPREAVSSYI
jgi:uncharacterized protein with PQ loop repeat